MALNKPFQSPPTTTSTLDVLEVVDYFGFSTETSSGLDYHLTTDAGVYSSQTQKTVSIPPTSLKTASFDLDFDLTTFNTPQVLKGTATFIATLSMVKGGGSAVSGSITVFIRKWDGTTETDLVSVKSPTVTSNGLLVNNEVMTLPLIIPRTPFKIGETLRVSVLGDGTRFSGDPEAFISMGHSPRNTSGAYINPATNFPETTTILKAKIPYERDL